MTDSPPVEKVDPETLILRAKPRRVIRIKRNLIIAGSAIGCIALVGLTWLGLSPSFIHPTLTVAHDKNPEKRAAGLPDHISALPKSYADMPQLGEPLPGDLGRPILEHRRLHGTEFAGREAGDMPVPPRAAGNPQGASGLFFQLASTAGLPLGASISHDRGLAAMPVHSSLSVLSIIPK